MLNNTVALLDSGVAAAVGDYESISTVTVTAGGGQASVEFTSIVGTYKHLQIRYMARCAGAYGAADPSAMRGEFNSDTTTTNYYSHYIRGNGATATAGANNGPNYFGWVPNNSITSGIFGVGIIDILDYANTNKNKTSRTLTGFDTNGGGSAYLTSHLWKNTAAITSIKLTAYDGNLVQNSSFALYGIK